ncbi:MAG: hypothetical protein WAM13_08180 [Candidatus Sulfotelmatobacter sp.]
MIHPSALGHAFAKSSTPKANTNCTVELTFLRAPIKALNNIHGSFSERVYIDEQLVSYAIGDIERAGGSVTIKDGAALPNKPFLPTTKDVRT